MLHLIDHQTMSEHRDLCRSMFRDRKTIFVDYLKWDLTCVGDEERDSFDNASARYLVFSDQGGTRHLGSVRLLPTIGSHLLGDVFPHLCEKPVPRSPKILEITRLCQNPHIRGEESRAIRNALACALVEYALARGITGYTGVTPLDFLARLLATGWRCTPLGLPKADGDSQIAAFLISIDQNTLPDMEAAGTYRPSGLWLEEANLSVAA